MEKYDVIFDYYKKYITENSKYEPRITKDNSKSSTYFPIIAFFQDDNTDEIRTQKSIEKIENYYFTIDIYAKNKNVDGKLIASQVIVDELKDLTLVFFEKLNMKKTQNRPVPNIDSEILRRTIKYQCQIDNRGNINRR